MAFHLRFDEENEVITSYDQILGLDASRYSAFARRLIESGVWVAYRGIWYVSAAHTSFDVDETLQRIERVVAAAAENV